MKVLHIIPYFTPRRGGDVNVCRNVATRLAARGHDVTIAATAFELDGAYKASLEAEGVSVKTFNVAFNASLFLYSPSMDRWLDDHVSGYDIVHMHDFRTYQNTSARRCCLSKSVPYVLQAHGDIPYSGQKGSLKAAYDIAWGKKLITGASCLLALTGTEASYYREMGADAERVVEIPNGVNERDFSCLPARGDFRKKHGIGEKETMALYLGRIHRTKSPDMLVRAFTGIPEATLVIAGPDSGEGQALKAMAASNGVNAIFPGFLSEADKRAALTDADMFVIPSYDGFPVAILEACACGTPVIATDRGDRLPWLDGEAGLVTCFSEECLRKAMQTLIADATLRKRLGEGGKRLVRERFTWDRICERLEKVYENCRTACALSIKVK